MKSNRFILFSKKCFVLFAFSSLVLCLSACAGAQDWFFKDLPGNYEVWRINSKTISLVNRVSGSGAETVVPSYVYEIAWNDDAILAKRIRTVDTPDSETLYYIVCVADGQVTGPLSESEFSDALEEKNIPLNDSDWVSVLKLKHQSE